jgi:antitoxin ParD1/3/4
VIRAGLRALDREEEMLEELWREKVQEAYADPRPSIPAAEVFRELREHHAARSKERR